MAEDNTPTAGGTAQRLQRAAVEHFGWRSLGVRLVASVLRAGPEYW